jgi:putative ABC transport system permease protein
MWAFNTTLRYSVSDPSKLDEAASQLSGWFESRFGESQIAISNPRGEAQKLIDRNAGIGILILFLSLSGLFIALVNVSHILMSRGLRMRKGVGIMMALGASRRSVLGLFASEATAVAVAGSLIGGAFAFPLSRTMQNALGLSGGSWLFVLAGVALSWILTMACSIAPAWQNSRIVPADAMRAA